MPIERRQILLSDEEFTHAIEAYCNANPSSLPRGNILQVNVGPGAGNCTIGGVIMTVGVCPTYGETELRINMRVRETDIVNLLVRFCLRAMSGGRCRCRHAWPGDRVRPLHARPRVRSRANRGDLR